jgi:hypothetical protein
MVSDVNWDAARDLELIAQVDDADGVAGIPQGIATQPGRLTKPG